MSSYLSRIVSKCKDYAELARFYYKNYKMMRELENNTDVVGKALQQKAIQAMNSQEKQFESVLKAKNIQSEHMDIVQKHIKESQPRLMALSKKMAMEQLKTGKYSTDEEIMKAIEEENNKRTKSGLTHKEEIFVDITKDLVTKEITKVLSEQLKAASEDNLSRETFEAKKHAHTDRNTQRRQEKNEKVEAARQRLMERRRGTAAAASAPKAPPTSTQPPQEQV